MLAILTTYCINKFLHAETPEIVFKDEFMQQYIQEP